MKTVVQRRLANEIILTKQFADFSDYYGFEVRLCTPGKPRSKGKVENFAGYVRKNFLPRIRSGQTLENWNHDALRWLEKTANNLPNGTTGMPPKERFSEETSELLPWGKQPEYLVEEWEKRKVSPSGHISVEGRLYPISNALGGKDVEIRYIDTNTFHVRYDGNIIAEHKLTGNPFKLVIANSSEKQMKKEQANGLTSFATSSRISQAPEATARSLAWYEQLLEEVSRND
ncbi:Mu transposase domain-containing protein [Candidatus Formimonas warabiya]|uniref:Integrase catalytic domain-containing protein n=1 Tax=Formimonas warabiya TaxID=1761012 RepID=A0A3G1KP82_FORW1|nr:transposase [Candidatus Formimonas warabiya]ATW24272.1 hypothetical protein DCMF_05245 [Candidatus Formimonas warabiya]